MDDVILVWNLVALDANRDSETNGKGEQTGPTLASRALAIVHLAMYDAFAGIYSKPLELPPYLLMPQLTPKPGASLDTAVASAAHRTLSSLFPSQRPIFDAEFAAVSLERVMKI